MVGIKLPVEPLRRMLVPTEPFDQFPHTAPMIIDMSNGFHFRPESRGFLLAWNDPEETPGYKTDFEPSFIEKILTRAADRVPAFENEDCGTFIYNSHFIRLLALHLAFSVCYSLRGF